MKYYFESSDSEMCYSIDYFREIMKETGAERMEVYSAVRLTSSEFFYCKEYYSVGVKSDSECGLKCKDYSPRNGKNGICKHNRNPYKVGEKVTITMK